MHLKYKLGAVAGAVAIAVPAVVAMTANGAHAATDMTLMAHVTNFQIPGQPPNTFPGQNGQPPAPGDRFLERADLTQNGAPVGFDTIACTFAFNNNTLCTEVLALTGRGDLFGVSLPRPGPQGPPQVFDVAITGGTFQFNQARGDIHITETSAGDQLDIHLH